MDAAPVGEPAEPSVPEASDEVTAPEPPEPQGDRYAMPPEEVRAPEPEGDPAEPPVPEASDEVTAPEPPEPQGDRYAMPPEEVRAPEPEGDPAEPPVPEASDEVTAPSERPEPEGDPAEPPVPEASDEVTAPSERPEPEGDPAEPLVPEVSDEVTAPAETPETNEAEAPESEEAVAPLAAGAASEPGNGLPKRTIAVVVALIFALASVGVAYGVFRGDGADGAVGATSPETGKKNSKDPGKSQQGQPGKKGAKGHDADLAIVDLTRTSVEVKNVGDGRAGRFTVAVDRRSFVVEDGLRAGDRASFKFPCREGKLTAVADPDDRVDEADERDNELTAGPFECKGSNQPPPDDPSPSDDPPPSEDPSPSDDGPPQGGGSAEEPDLMIRSLAKDRIVVANTGDGPAGDFVVDVGRAGRFRVGRLSPGATKTFTFACTRQPSARVDAEDDVRESNESNNGRTAGPYTCLADLIVSAIEARSVTIQNIGVGGARSSVISIEGNSFRVPAIAPGGQYQLGYPCLGGFVHATADAFDDVQESNEGNNNASHPVGECLTTNRIAGPSKRLP